MRYLLWMLAFATVSAHAEWLQGETDGGVIYAGTYNRDLDMLFQSCTTTPNPTCTWFLLIDTSCTENATASAIMSGPGNASAGFTLNCIGVAAQDGKKMYRYALSPFDTVDPILRASGTVGLAFPLMSGQFRVVRFETVGAAALLDQARQKALEKSQHDTRGQKH